MATDQTRRAPPRPGTRKTFAPSFAFHVSPVTGIGHDRTPAVVPRPPLSAHEVSPRRRLSQPKDFPPRVRSRGKEIRNNNNNNNNNNSSPGNTPWPRAYRSPLLLPPPLFFHARTYDRRPFAFSGHRPSSKRVYTSVVNGV